MQHSVASKWEDLPKTRLIAEFSLWSADLLNLRREVERSEPFADMFHIDACDGHIAPSFLFFPDLLRQIRRATERPLHVHLMATEDILASQIDQFAEAGADLITIQFKSGMNILPAIDRVLQRGCRAGVALPLDSPIHMIEPYLEKISFATLMGTSVGIKGQSLAPLAFSRLEETRLLLETHNLQDRIFIGADGAIRKETVPALRAHGADTIVMGSLAFDSEDLAKTMDWVYNLPSPPWKNEVRAERDDSRTGF